LTEQPKKISLAEAAKQRLEQKKQSQANDMAQLKHNANQGQSMRSQQTKKANNQRRRTGV
jgi:hypothetical protein